ncbi:MAG: beta-lactamase family protein [Candidatus Handelsmanbacteria bacterium]|nr:beta-lactamase family protein [Candidatus Handelsmanbacteria bacterium]
MKTIAPAQAGISAKMLELAGQRLAEAVAAGQLTAASLVVARHGSLVFAQGYGCLSPDPASPAVQPDSVFLLASITKPVTAGALMRLVDRGQISLDDPVNQYLPEFQGGERPQVKVRHLLSHTSGLPDMLPENTALRRAHAPLGGFVEGALRTPLLYSPGKGFAYQSMGTLLAGEIVERVSGKRLRDFEQEELFAPLGMEKSALGLGRFQIPQTVWCGNTLQESEDERRWGANSPYWRDMGHPWGGMHSTGLDLAVLLQTVLNGGEYEGRRLFSPAAARAMTTDQNPGLQAPWGLGWALRDSRVWNYFGELCSPSTFGHIGATGTAAWADPAQQMVCVVLTNQMVAGGSLLRRVANAVSAAVVE